MQRLSTKQRNSDSYEHKNKREEGERRTITMVDFKWIQMSLFLISALQFPEAAEQHPPSFTVRAGHEVTLPCGNVIEGQQKCNYTTWLFSGGNTSVELITHGQKKSDRLSVTENCSLVIKKVTAEDAGRHFCQQYNSGGKKQGPDSQVHLSVINMTEHKDDDKVTLNCSVSTYERCRHTVKWLFQGNDVGKDNKDLKTSQSLCNTSVTFLTSHYIYTSRYKVFTCEVTDGDKVLKFPLRPQTSGEKPGEDTTTTTTTTKTTTTAATTTTTATTRKTTTATATKSTRTTKNDVKTGTFTTASKTKDVSTELGAPWWWLIIVAVVLVALLIIVVAVIRWKRTKGNKTRRNDNVGPTSNAAGTQSGPETSQDTVHPEDGVSYASISFTKKTSSKSQVLGKDDDDEDEAVTYSTVKASSSSSAGASADPSDLYTTVNKPKK